MQESKDKDIEQLIQYSIGFADEVLRKHGEFYPFASYIGLVGELMPLAIYSGNEFPDSNDLIREFELLFEQQRINGELIAYAIAIDVRVTNKRFPQSTDAVAIRTFHVQNERQVTYYFPYQKNDGNLQIFEGWGEVS